MHHIVQEEVLSQLINRVLTNAAGYVIHYIGIIIFVKHHSNMAKFNE